MDAEVPVFITASFAQRRLIGRKQLAAQSPAAPGEGHRHPIDGFVLHSRPLRDHSRCNGRTQRRDHRGEVTGAPVVRTLAEHPWKVPPPVSRHIGQKGFLGTLTLPVRQHQQGEHFTVTRHRSCPTPYRLVGAIALDVELINRAVDCRQEGGQVGLCRRELHHLRQRAGRPPSSTIPCFPSPRLPLTIMCILRLWERARVRAAVVPVRSAAPTRCCAAASPKGRGSTLPAPYAASLLARNPASTRPQSTMRQVSLYSAAVWAWPGTPAP